jgi:hypothetical protein
MVIGKPSVRNGAVARRPGKAIALPEPNLSDFGYFIRTPNRKPHFMTTRGTFINADMRVSVSRSRKSAVDTHFFSAPTRWHFGASRYQQSLKIRHVAA